MNVIVAGSLLAALILTVLSKRSIQNLWKERACQSYQIDGKTQWEVHQQKKEIKVLFLGDIGSGSENQRKVAEASAKTCSEKGCDFAVLAGDNFIQKGITGTADEQLDRKFESMYSQEFPFYAVLGNHDLKGNWRAQIDYSKLSQRWNLLGTNYELKAGPIHFKMINTTCTMKTIWSLFKKSDNPWQVVIGHHPVVSSGRHGGMTWLERFIVNRTGIDFFISGHNHVLEHVVSKGFEQIVSGAGGSPIEPSSRPRLTETKFYHEDFGYIWAEFTPTLARFIYFDINGKEIYSFERIR